MNRNPDVDAWLDNTAPLLGAVLRRARDIILGADPRVTESIKWKTPTFAYQGNIASFNSSKHMVSIMFHRGARATTDPREGGAVPDWPPPIGPTGRPAQHPTNKWRTRDR